MKTMHAGRAAALAVLALMLTAPAGETQQGSQFPQFPQQDPMGPIGPTMPAPKSKDPRTQIPPHIDDDTSLGKPTGQQISSMNTARQKQIVADTEKLLALAQQLKADVDKSTKDTLSLDVIKKSDEIERLAHTVKEKMKN